jgi:hypothetical protein
VVTGGSLGATPKVHIGLSSVPLLYIPAALRGSPVTEAYCNAPPGVVLYTIYYPSWIEGVTSSQDKSLQKSNLCPNLPPLAANCTCWGICWGICWGTCSGAT